MAGAGPYPWDKSENKKEPNVCSYETHNQAGETENKQQMFTKQHVTTVQKEWHNGRRKRKLEPGKEAHKCGAGRGLQNKLGMSGEGSSLSEGDTARWRGSWNCRHSWASSGGQTSGPK